MKYLLHNLYKVSRIAVNVIIKKICFASRIKFAVGMTDVIYVASVLRSCYGIEKNP